MNRFETAHRKLRGSLEYHGADPEQTLRAIQAFLEAVADPEVFTEAARDHWPATVDAAVNALKKAASRLGLVASFASRFASGDDSS